MQHRHFFDAIHTLRTREEILLHQKILQIDAADAADAVLFLHSEWDNERLEYPGTAPGFNEPAALWGARTLYFAAQLQLYRDQNMADALDLLPAYDGTVDAGAMLSADLCLRMLPVVVEQLRLINPDDGLIPQLEAHLHQFHYSSVGLRLGDDMPDFSRILDNDCLMQLYVDRVIGRQDRQRAEIPELASWLNRSMGD
jgi:hypothetical protein